MTTMLKTVIDRTFPLDQFDAALQHLRSGNPVGRVVLKL
jgi:NADPH:quinone reductase-like Zn-dependent oxidoreductase